MGESLSDKTLTQNNKIESFLIEWLILFVCIGYPIQAMVPIMLKTASTPINTGFRVVYLLVSLYLIWRARKKKKAIHSKSLLIFLFFWIIYSYRIISDIQFNGKSFLGIDSFYVYSFAFGSSFALALSVFMNGNLINLPRITKNLFYILLISNVCIIANLLFYSTGGLAASFISRANVNAEINGETISVVNGITLAFTGELLSLVSIIFLIFNPLNWSANHKYLLWGTTLLGIINLLLGASRGPLVSFILLLLYIIFSYLKLKHFSVVSILKFFSWLFGILLASLIFIVPIWNNLNLEIINRMTSFYTERQIGGKIEERDFEWASAWRQFVENPIFGDSFVNDFDKSYAHNLFLDSLMATGVVGTILLIYLTYKSFSSFIKSSRSLKVQLLPIWITYLSILILSLTSGGLFVAFPFWIMLAVTIKIPIYANYKY